MRAQDIYLSLFPRFEARQVLNCLSQITAACRKTTPALYMFWYAAGDSIPAACGTA